MTEGGVRGGDDTQHKDVGRMTSITCQRSQQSFKLSDFR